MLLTCTAIGFVSINKAICFACAGSPRGIVDCRGWQVVAISVVIAVGARIVDTGINVCS
jgi:hypothetical protein